jgi:hypothetical protein
MTGGTRVIVVLVAVGGALGGFIPDDDLGCAFELARYLPLTKIATLSTCHS